jgi:hypothetical protein
MIKITKILTEMTSAWGSPRNAIHHGMKCPFLLKCSFSPTGIDVEKYGILQQDVPDEVKEFWLYAECARLFEDLEYGQWGIEILCPRDAINESKLQLLERPEDFKDSDLVLGRFLGDSDLLIVTCSSDNDYGSTLVAKPLDKRKDWPCLARSLSRFFVEYMNYQGDKFWE